MNHHNLQNFSTCSSTGNDLGRSPHKLGAANLAAIGTRALLSTTFHGRKCVIGGNFIVVVPQGYSELASVSYGEDEWNPAYERTCLMARIDGQFCLVGGGGRLTVWRSHKNESWSLDCGIKYISRDDALAWVGRYDPESARKVLLILRCTAGGETR
jgi:hypothetical protein